MKRLLILEYPTDIIESCQSKKLQNLELNDLFLETNFKQGMKNIILCKDQKFKILKKWGKPPKESKVYDIAHLNKVIASL